jgi:hypothetical protein
MHAHKLGGEPEIIQHRKQMYSFHFYPAIEQLFHTKNVKNLKANAFYFLKSGAYQSK